MENEIKMIIHKYAAWAASRAASVKGCRFTVKSGQYILEDLAIHRFILNPDILPDKALEFNAQHKQWREHIIELSKSETCPVFTHGVAAKLINVYFKTIFLCGGFHNHYKVNFIHPPIDSILMKELAKLDKCVFWRKMNVMGWSNFSSEDYERVISELQYLVVDKPLWSVEKHWRGYQ